ncbi:MAG: N-acetyltransferase [Planctomycetes bacterium]|nr:N-acetyltransferase [Planctomycetota bacterium]
MANYIHPTACVDSAAEIGDGTKIWHFSHIMAGARIGGDCSLGQNVFVAGGVVLGNHVKVLMNPRCEIVRKSEYRPTRVLRGATIGANATIVCGVTIGRYAMIGAGAVVIADVPQYALMVGVPGAQRGWYSRHGYRLPSPAADGIMVCPGSGWRYRLDAAGLLACLDWPEDKPLSAVESHA